jgi:acyl carrier protein
MATTAVCGALARVLNRSVDEIRPESRLDADLGLDSLGMIHARIVIEEQLRLATGIEPPEAPFMTVADLITFVHRRVVDAEAPSC